MFIRLEAINTDKNIYRRYEILLQKGLLGSFVVIRVWGRMDNESTHSLTNAFDTEESARKFMAKLLRKQLKAQNRLGVNYHLLDDGG